MTLTSNDTKGTKSLLKVISTIFISFIGAGILGLPYAFKEAGLFESIIILSLVGIVSVKAMFLIIDCKNTLSERNSYLPLRNELDDDSCKLSNGHIPNGNKGPRQSSDHPSINYGDVGSQACGKVGQIMVEICLIVSQIGFCCAYNLFLCHNLSHTTGYEVYWHWLFAILPPIFILCLFREIKNLGYVSFVAQISNLLAFVLVIFADFRKISEDIQEPKQFLWGGIPFFVAVSIYCYEGAGMILSLESAVHKSLRSKFKIYFNGTMIFVTLLYISFGASGYLAYGSATKSIITLNLPKGGYIDIGLVVTACLGVALFLTYPLMMFPVTSMIENKLEISSKYWMGNVLRLCLVLVTGFIVYFVPHFSDLMGFIGAGCCIPLAFLFPGIFHLMIHKKSLSYYQIAVDVCLILIGIFGMSIGLWDAIIRLGTNKQNQLSDHIYNSTLSKHSELSTVAVQSNV